MSNQTTRDMQAVLHKYAGACARPVEKEAAIGLLGTAGLGSIAAAIWAFRKLYQNQHRKSEMWRDVAGKDIYEQDAGLRAIRDDYNKLRKSQEQRMSEYRRGFTPNSDGSYYDPTGTTLLGHSAYMKRLGWLQAEQDRHRNNWHEDRMREYAEKNPGVLDRKFTPNVQSLAEEHRGVRNDAVKNAGWWSRLAGTPYNFRGVTMFDQSPLRGIIDAVGGVQRDVAAKPDSEIDQTLLRSAPRHVMRGPRDVPQADR